MAEKRMFARKIIDSDAFLEMPLSAQALYFHLNMRADDDGFVNNPKRITDYVNASVDDLKILLTKRFVIGFESGVIVIRHWKIHNTIKSDRYRLTDYQEELARLLIEPSKAYSEAPLTPQLSQAEQMVPNRFQSGSTLEPEIRIGKISIGLDEKKREERENRGAGEGKPPVSDLTKQSGAAAPTPAGAATRHKHGAHGWVRLTEEEYARLIDDLGEEELTRCIDYIDESAQSTGNKNRWKDWNLVIRRCSRDRWGIRNGSGNGERRGFGRNAMDELQQLHQMYESWEGEQDG